MMPVEFAPRSTQSDEIATSSHAIIPLGSLQSVRVRDAWPDEARNFTPWLAEAGIKLLSKEIGVDLKVVRCEHAVGRYSLDILAAPSGTSGEEQESQLVVIENQFGSTDHDHLGKLMTYASGVGEDNQGAKTIIWIAEDFREEHRRALEWLNEVTRSGVRFYGVQLEVYRIGNSAAAPCLNLLVRPNEVVRARREVSSQSGDLERTSEKNLFYIEYWTAFKAYCVDNNAEFKLQTPRPEHYIFATLGRTGVQISFISARRDKWIGCQLYINDADAASTLTKLEANRAHIDEVIPGLVWQHRVGSKSAKIELRNDSPPGKKELWSYQHEWMLTQGNKFYSTFEPLVRNMK